MRALGTLWAGAATLAAPGLRLLLARRLLRGKEIAARLPERRGIDPTPRPPGRLVWLHAASVGESLSVLPVLAAMDASVSVLLTTGTVTSARLLDRLLPDMDLAGRVRHRFVPLDVPAWAGRFLDHWRPDAAGFVESEVWPNMLAACAKRGIPTMLVNARLSARSFAKWRRLPGLATLLFGGFARVQAQSAEDAARLSALGARDVSAPGNLKFAAAALPADPGELAALRAAILGPAWIAASTHPGEEALALEAHRTLAAAHPGLTTIIAPRHPDRGAAVAALAAGLPVTRRALGEPPAPGVHVADTLGDLGLFYRLGAPVFVGGSLVRHGGQNPLEPARLGAPVAVGPHTGNFAEAVALLRAAGALTVLEGPAALAPWADALLRDPVRRAAMGHAGQGAADRFADLPRHVAETLLGLMRGD